MSPPSPSFRGLDLNYQLPPTVAAARDGYQWVCTSGATVSGLLAATAAQLLSLFQSNPGTSNLVIGLCFAAICLNVAATIGSFIITNALTDVPSFSARQSQRLGDIDTFDGGSSHLMRFFGVGKRWNFLLCHWLFNFYCGIISLVLAIAIYVWQQQTRGTAIGISVVIGTTLIPVAVFVLQGQR